MKQLRILLSISVDKSLTKIVEVEDHLDEIDYQDILNEVFENTPDNEYTEDKRILDRSHSSWELIETELPKPKILTSELKSAIQDVLNNADNTGCSDTLTVTSQEAIKALEKAYKAL